MKIEYRKIGHWTVLGDIKYETKHYRTVLARCDCGYEARISYANLWNGKSTQCRACSIANSRAAHYLYSTWRNMRNRCYSPKNKDYPAYGGRGIRIYDEWSEFRAFARWVDATLGERPVGYTLDVDGDYAPGNLKWSTHKEQANNRRAGKAKAALAMLGVSP